MKINLGEYTSEYNETTEMEDQAKLINFIVAKELPYSAYKKIQHEVMKMEALYKLYCIGVIQNNKETRIKAMKVIKENCEILPASLTSFKKYWKIKQEKKEKSPKK